MPSIVRVTNLDNGQSTVVRINDRGPFARSRVIDLSRTAAEELDIVRNGTARVRIEQLQAESLAVKEVAISGGGPAEQRRRWRRSSSGRAPAPAQAPVAGAGPDGRLRAAASRAGTGVRAACARPAGLADQSRSAAAEPARRVRCRRQATGPTRGLARHAARRLQPASGFYVQTGAFSTPENAEKPARRREQLRRDRRFPRRRRAAARSIACAWDPIRLRMPPASSPTG